MQQLTIHTTAKFSPTRGKYTSATHSAVQCSPCNIIPCVPLLPSLSVLKYGRARPLPKLEPHARQHRMEELNHMYKQGAAATGNSNGELTALMLVKHM